MAIYRKEVIKNAVEYSTGLPQVDAQGRIVPQKAVYDVLCDTVSDVVSDETLAIGSMAYVREVAEGADHRYVKVADNGVSADWEVVDQVAAEEEAAL